MAGLGLPKQQPRLDVTIAFKEVTIVERIGFGSFGHVYKARHDGWNCTVAYKKLKLDFVDPNKNAEELKLISGLKKEAAIHANLRHPNIVLMMASVFEEDQYGLVLEYVMHGSLDSFLKKLLKKNADANYIPWLLKTKMAHEIASGLAYLHSLKPSPIIHGDLKSQNILVGEYFIVKIADFGLSQWSEYISTYSSVRAVQGTSTHIPPERWKDPKLRANKKFDVYAYSILLFELYTNVRVFANLTYPEIKTEVMSSGRPSLDDLPHDIPVTVTTVIQECWQQEPADRPEFEGASSITATLGAIVSGMLPENEIRSAKVGLQKFLECERVILSAHGAKIARVRQQLVDCMRRTDVILTALLQKQFLTPNEFQQIKSRACTHEVVQHLLDVLTEKSEAAFACFLDALDATPQEDLYRLLVEDGFQLDVGHRAVLLGKYRELKENIRLSGSILLSCLLQNEVLNTEEVATILSKPTEHEKIDELLAILLRTSAKQYRVFISLLPGADHQHIQQLLAGEEEEEPLLKGYENWLALQDAQLMENVHSLEQQVAMLRKTKNALSAKQRVARKNGNELSEGDAQSLTTTSTEQSALQKQLNGLRKQQRTLRSLLSEYRAKHPDRMPVSWSAPPLGGPSEPCGILPVPPDAQLSPVQQSPRAWGSASPSDRGGVRVPHTSFAIPRLPKSVTSQQQGCMTLSMRKSYNEYMKQRIQMQRPCIEQLKHEQMKQQQLLHLQQLQANSNTLGGPVTAHATMLIPGDENDPVSESYQQHELSENARQQQQLAIQQQHAMQVPGDWTSLSFVDEVDITSLEPEIDQLHGRKQADAAINEATERKAFSDGYSSRHDTTSKGFLSTYNSSMEDEDDREFATALLNDMLEDIPQLQSYDWRPYQQHEEVRTIAHFIGANDANDTSWTMDDEPDYSGSGIRELIRATKNRKRTADGETAIEHDKKQTREAMMAGLPSAAIGPQGLESQIHISDLGAGLSPDTAQANQDILKNVKKRKNFLSTLLKLTANQPASTVSNVQQLIQDLIDGNVEPEAFTARLENELNSTPQPYLVPFLKKYLPLLRHSLSAGSMRIEGVKSPQPGSSAALHAASVSVATVIGALSKSHTAPPGAVGPPGGVSPGAPGSSGQIVNVQPTLVEMSTMYKYAW